MGTTRRVVGMLRVLLALAFAALGAAQVVVLPSLWGELAADSPELADVRWPSLGVAVLGLLCVQVVIVCTWRLLALVEADRIFSEASVAWVDAIVWAIVAECALLAGALLYCVAVWGVAGPSTALLLTLVAAAVLGLLVVVLRALLLQATTLRTDMEAVI
ncbi:DUF2975 domain-containing protein [Geodermatophilus sp. SYSU D00691]